MLGFGFSNVLNRSKYLSSSVLPWLTALNYYPSVNVQNLFRQSFCFRCLSREVDKRAQPLFNPKEKLCLQN